MSRVSAFARLHIKAIIFVFALVLLLVAARFSPAYYKCVKEIRSGQQSQNASEHVGAMSDPRACVVDGLYDTHGIVTAIATVVLCVFTGTLWVATRDLAELAKGQEKSIRAHERAYLVGGGLRGKPMHSSPAKEPDWRTVSATNYDGPWDLVIHNYGRTPGFVVSVEHGTCGASDYPTHERVSAIIQSGRLQTTRVLVNEVIPPTGLENPIRYRHIDTHRLPDYVFFGRIAFRDIFGTEHHSSFAHRHGVHKSDTIGTSFVDDWD